MKKALLLTATLSFLLSYTFAQHAVIHKLVVAKGETYTVGPDNILLVDTLIMHDKSTVVFAPQALGLLQANVAIIGNKCTISSKGNDGASSNVGVAPNRQQMSNKFTNTGKTLTLMNGEVIHADPIDKGTRGQDGGDLKLSLHFERLGSLVVDTRGGRGGNGTNGKNGNKGTPDRQEKRQVLGANGQYVTEVILVPGNKGTDGTDATAGLAGGNGGNIELTYSTNNFIPIFNNSKALNRISLLQTAGDAGRDGIPGTGGFSSFDGRVVRSGLQDSKDGQIKLINANNTFSKED